MNYSRANVTDRNGNPYLFVGALFYKLETSLFGLVVKVVGHNGQSEFTAGVFFKPMAASVGIADTNQLILADKQKREALEYVQNMH